MGTARAPSSDTEGLRDTEEDAVPAWAHGIAPVPPPPRVELDRAPVDLGRIVIRAGVAAVLTEVALVAFVVTVLARGLTIFPPPQLLGYGLGFGLGVGAAWAVADAVSRTRARLLGGLLAGVLLAPLAPLGGEFEAAFAAKPATGAATRAALAAAGATPLSSLAWLLAAALACYGPVLALRRRGCTPATQAAGGLLGAGAWAAAVVTAARPALDALPLSAYALLLAPRAPLFVLGLRAGDGAARVVLRRDRHRGAPRRAPLLALLALCVGLAGVVALGRHGPAEQARTTLARIAPGLLAPASAIDEADRLTEPGERATILPAGPPPPPAPDRLQGPWGGLGEALRVAGATIPIARRAPTPQVEGTPFEEAEARRELARRLLRDAAGRGESAAAWALVGLLEATAPLTADARARDRREAVVWLRWLADRGHLGAELDLVARLLEGCPMPGDRFVDEMARDDAERTRDELEGLARLPRASHHPDMAALRGVVQLLRRRPRPLRLLMVTAALRALALRGERYAAEDLATLLARNIELRRPQDEPLIDAAPRLSDAPLPLSDVGALLAHLVVAHDGGERLGPAPGDGPPRTAEAQRAYGAPRLLVAARAAAWGTLLRPGPSSRLETARAHRALAVTDLLRAAGRKRLREVEVELALAHLLRADLLDPGHPAACLDEALAHALLAIRSPGSKHVRAARELLLVAGELDPTLGAEASAARATIEALLARLMVRRVNPLDLDDAVAARLRDLARARIARGLVDARARELLDAALRRRPAWRDALALRAWIRAALGDSKGARDDLTAARG